MIKRVLKWATQGVTVISSLPLFGVGFAVGFVCLSLKAGWVAAGDFLEWAMRD